MFLRGFLFTFFIAVTSFGSISNHRYQDRLAEAIEFLNENADQFTNLRYITLIDFSLPSAKPRLFLVDLRTGITESFLVAHGRNSGLLYAKQFSNDRESFMSSLGFYKTGSIYYGKHGKSLNLHGMSESNSNAYQRRIVIHAADYASPETVKIQGRLGRSLGCPAVSKESLDLIILRIKEGSLIYAFN